ncbi:hypothetical protein [Oceanithermus sp.]
MEDLETKVQAPQEAPPPAPPEPEPQPQPDPASPPWAGSSNDAESSVGPQPDPEEAYPDFEPLEAEGEPEAEAPAGAAPQAPEPFTGEEIASGVAMALMMGLKIASDEERAAFERAFTQAVPFMPTPFILDTLKVGEALAAYGIHKGMTGPADLARLPAWLRLLLGAATLGMAGYSAARAVMEVRRGREADPGAAGGSVAGQPGPRPVPTEA